MVESRFLLCNVLTIFLMTSNSFNEQIVYFTELETLSVPHNSMQGLKSKLPNELEIGLVMVVISKERERVYL